MDQPYLILNMILLDGSGTRCDPVGVARTPYPPYGEIPPRPRRPAARLQNTRLRPHACGPLDPASFQSGASLECEKYECPVRTTQQELQFFIHLFARY